MKARMFGTLFAALAVLLLATSNRAAAQTPTPVLPPPTGTFTAGSIPPGGGFGLVVFGGGSFEQLVSAAACRATTTAAFWSTNAAGNFVTFVPSTTVGAVNAGFAAQFPTGSIPANTPLIGRCAPTSGQIVVTNADHNTSVTMRVGDTFTLNLGDRFNWNVEVGNPQILTRVVNIQAPPPGVQGVFYANARGTTTLDASGGLNCPPNMACPAIAGVFHVTIIVQ